MLQVTLEKIKENKAIICIIGLGRVGLPLATSLANCGAHVIGIDKDEEKLESVKKVKSPFYDPLLQESLKKAMEGNRFEVNSDLTKLDLDPDIIIVTVGTPTIENNIDYSQIYSALGEICKIDLKNKMLIFRSTVPPKTTTDIIVPFVENQTNLTSGEDFGIAMCPERILEGKAIQELNELPEIIGGVNQISNEIAASVFLLLNPTKTILFTTPTGAELCKLFANIFRYATFALANEFAIWAEMYGLDAAELIKIVNYEYPRANIPQPGFTGGPCLSKDGIFLSSEIAFSSIISSVWKLNESIPQHIVNNLKKLTGNLFNKKIALLGLSFKANSDDLRNSPSVRLSDILKSLGANVMIHDPHVNGTMKLSEVLASPDIVIIATNHREFQHIKTDIDKSGCKLVYDVWGIFNEKDFSNIKYARFGKSIS